MKKIGLFILTVSVLVSCSTTDYSTNVTGVHDNVTIVVKDFITLGIVTVETKEIHHSSALGFSKSIQGSKVTYADLMQEAAKLEADDVINIRIDVNNNYTKKAFDWLTGWSRTYTYTGTALAIKYTEKLEAHEVTPQYGTLPRIPETTGAVKKTRDGRTQLR